MITIVGMFEYFNDQLRQYWQQATWDLGSGCVYLGLDWSQWSQWSCHSTVSLSLSLWMTRHKTNKEKILQAPSPLSLRHQAGDIKLVQVILEILSAMDGTWLGIYELEF